MLAAVVGFGGVWYAQNRIARNAREEREHRERSAREEREHRALLAKQQLEEEIANRRTALIHAMSGELSALHPAVCHTHQIASLAAAVYEQYGKGIEQEKIKPIIPFQKFDTPVYDHHIAHMGLLPPLLVHSLVSVYTRLRASHFAPPTHEAPEVTVDANVILAQAARDGYLKLRDDIHDVVMRLNAVRLGYIDPGLGKATNLAPVYRKNLMIPQERTWKQHRGKTLHLLGSVAAVSHLTSFNPDPQSTIGRELTEPSVRAQSSHRRAAANAAGAS